MLFVFLLVSLSYGANSMYYAREVIQSNDDPLSLNNPYDLDGTKMMNLGIPNKIYTASDRTELFNFATAKLLLYFGINITDANYNPANKLWVVPGVGYMAQTLYGGCNDLASQSNVTYKVVSDSAYPLRGTIFEWCVINPTFSFLFSTNGTISSGLSAGQKYLPGDVISNGYTLLVRKGSNWKLPFNIEFSYLYCKDIVKSVITSQGFQGYMGKAIREDAFGTAEGVDANQVVVRNGVPYIFLRTVWLYPNA